ncbi:hypothetical protein EJ02DRAFT_454813 [Clathrospora elynae]|uniref:Uncharacterized protein n=1 Tax=Clathrospora elynae TaxID=706981 RepID=A0A6A5SQ67_9PLEO|nr:hypothetical protein EJ02DRAFT_454813 [Clathrospora elynae]
MQFRIIAAAVAALGVGASAQTSVAPDVQASVLLALAKAIPTDIASYALASSSAFAAEMASSLSAGETPSWYRALPTDVQSWLPQIYPEATPTPSISSVYEVTSSSSKVVVTPYPYPTGKNSTSAAPTMSATGSTPAVIVASSSGPAAPAFTGAAAKLSTGAVGASLGAALGLIGMLAL